MKRIRSCFPVLVSLLLVLPGGQVVDAAQNDNPQSHIKELSPSGEILSPAIPFVASDLQIDGFLDIGLQALAKRNFNAVMVADEGNPIVGNSFRLAYNQRGLYVFLEFGADRITCRDRGHQNGDGIIMVLATPDASGSTDQHIVLGFSPTPSAKDLLRKFVWKHNEKWSFKRLSERSEFAYRSAEGTVGYEVMLAWDDVYPYHPWAMDQMGMNLYFTKAVGDTQTNWHGLKFDPTQQGIDFTLYQKVVFDPPASGAGLGATVQLARNHLFQGDPITFRTSVHSPDQASKRLGVEIFSGENQLAAFTSRVLEFQKGFNRRETVMEIGDLIPGGYRLKWRLGDCHGQTFLSVLPPLDFLTTRERISESKGKISAGSITTLQFKLQEITRIKELLNPDGRSFELRRLIGELNDLIDAAGAGRDVLGEKTGYLRRAFRSGLDGTLRPYTVRIPRDYDASRSWPAIVYLHGSDSDDTALEKASFLSGDQFIQIAPHGRGARNCYLPEAAQADINEALADAMKNYSINPDKILLAGFSMGGYGVYVTHLHNPETYRGLIVLSGHPNLGNEYLNSDHAPNFLDESNLSVFQGTDMIILHGARDRNCEFEMTDKAAALLKKSGARVEYHVDPNVGHSAPRAPEILMAYDSWLHRMMEGE